MDIDKILKKILEIDDLVSKKHSHTNKGIIDSITQALIGNWNNAYTHISDAVKHITSTERTNWNDANSKKHTHSNKTILDTISQTNLNNWEDKYTKTEVDNKISQVVTSLDYKEHVSTFSDIAISYPQPEEGWTVSVDDKDIVYRYDGLEWKAISANSIPLASSSVDGKMSKQDKIDHDDMNSKKHTHSNKSVIDTITQALIDNWSAAYTHISDTVKHITSSERTNWNTAYTNNHTHSNKSVLDAITAALINNWNSAYTHISDIVKHITSTERTNWNEAYSKEHDHSNKSIIDIITQTLIYNWNAAYSHISDTVKHITSDERTLWNTVSNKFNSSGGDITGNVKFPNDSKLEWNRNTDYARISFKNTSDGDTDSYMQFLMGDNGNEYFKFDSVSGSTTTELLTIKSDYLRFKGNKVYHEGNKPTPADIGASASGHTHTKSQITDMPTKLSEFLNDSGFITQTDVDTSQNHTHANKSILDTITQTLINNWNAAHSHISDTVKHITSDERTLWNNKMSESDSWRNKPQILSANTDLNDIYASGIYTGDSDGNSGTILNRPVTTAQGFILHVHNVWSSEGIGGRQVQIYIARDGKMFTRNKEQNGSWQSWWKVYSEIQKPTPADIGASASGHTHDDRYYTETESDAKFATKSEISTAGYGDMLRSVYDTNGDGIVDNADTLDGKHASEFALASHGNHVPVTETANNSKFLRNDNSWQTVTPGNIGAVNFNADFTIPEKSTTGTHYTKLLTLTCSKTYHRISETIIINSRTGAIILTLRASSDNSTLFNNYSLEYIALNNTGYNIISRILCGVISISDTQNKIELWFQCVQWSEVLSISRLHTNGDSAGLVYSSYSFNSTAPTFNTTITSSDVYARLSHNHDGAYYTETEIDSKITYINSLIDGKANSSHNHNSLVSIGRKTASDLPSTWATGLYMTEVYNNGFPCSYGNCLTLKSGNSAITQICMEWKGSDATIGSMWIRNKRDSGTDAWSAWREFSFGDHNHDSTYVKKGALTWNQLKGV